MDELGSLAISTILTHLLISAAVGGVIGYERRLRHKAIGVAGMVLVATGSTT